jgi:hypothetical protein
MLILLRIAAVVAAIQYAAHTLLFLRASPTHGVEEVELVQRMKQLKWDFSGFRRSYWDFYFGYGLLVILWGIIEVALLWEVSTLTRDAPAMAMIVTLLLANVGHAILALRYFFLVPVVFDVVVAILLAAALFAG